MVTINNLPGTCNISAYRGDSLNVYLRLRDTAGELIDTSDLDAVAQVRNPNGALTDDGYPLILDITTGGADGTITLGIDGDTGDEYNVYIAVDASVMLDLTPGPKWIWDLQMWDPDDQEGTTQTFLRGWFRVNDDVTRIS